MQAMVLESFGAPLVRRTVPDPEPGPGEVVLRVLACGVCGSDLKIVSGALGDTPLPHVPGHEVAGEVVAQGPGVTAPRVGDRVACYFYLSCGECANCRNGRGTICLRLGGRIGFERDGGMAEYVRLPAALCLPVPDGVDAQTAAVLVDAIATPYHALITRGALAAGETAVVVGVGGLGLHAVQIAHAAGARVVAVDVEPRRLDRALALGADEAVRFGAEGWPPRGLAADLVLDTAAAPQTLADDPRLLRPGGRLIMVGYRPGLAVAWDTADLVLREISVLPSRAATKPEVERTLELVARGRVRAAIDRRFPVSAANEAISALRAGQLDGRAVLLPEW
jgi:2-desacetyl-2-hydroxyethyl bacteriochlorophyllide A dehydrogenase